MSIRQISYKVGLSKSLVHRLVTSEVQRKDAAFKKASKRKDCRGRQTTSSLRQRRSILRNLLALREKRGNFT